MEAGVDGSGAASAAANALGQARGGWAPVAARRTRLAAPLPLIRNSTFYCVTDEGGGGRVLCRTGGDREALSGVADS